MKKRLYFSGAAVAAAVAIVTSYFYAESKRPWLLALTGCAAMLLIVCVIGLLLCVRGGGAEKIYRKKKRYISEAEQAFLSVLRSAVDNRYEVCVQAPLVAVIDKTGSAFRNELFRVIDYLIVDRATYEPLLLIELNDASHNRADRKERDCKVAEICADARMPLLTFTTEQSRNTAEVQRAVRKALK